MRKATVYASVLAALLLVFGTAFALLQLDDVKKHPTCAYCNMDRGKFAMSRMLIEYSDGSEVGTCSLRCAALDLATNIGKTPKAIKVADYNTKELIDAENASWLLGGTQPGVMTGRAKWAFGSGQDASAFMEKNGGAAASFEEAIQAAYEDMYKDTKMIREKRKKMKKMNMGKMGH